jgi:hypothetical protein
VEIAASVPALLPANALVQFSCQSDSNWCNPDPRKLKSGLVGLTSVLLLQGKFTRRENSKNSYYCHSSLLYLTFTQFAVRRPRSRVRVRKETGR